MSGSIRMPYQFRPEDICIPKLARSAASAKPQIQCEVPKVIFQSLLRIRVFIMIPTRRWQIIRGLQFENCSSMRFINTPPPSTPQSKSASPGWLHLPLEYSDEVKNKQTRTKTPQKTNRQINKATPAPLHKFSSFMIWNKLNNMN